ncbi:MAG: winged helix-turn-helix domain-containing protein [Lachnospiraceae bacterium]|nr:winged helix-turn-helix domain-containing protein [Lachnospiraceae bacterium]
MKVLLCDPDLAWAEQLSEQLNQHGIVVKTAREAEELWYVTEEIQGVLVSSQELESMLLWGETAMVDTVSEASYFSAIHSLCQQVKKVILIMPELNYGAEYTGLQAGAAECIHKGQPMELVIQRILLAFQEEIHRQQLWFGGVQLDQQAGRLVFQGDTVKLTVMEQKVLEILFIYGSELAEKSEILLQVWGEQTGQCGQRLDTIIRKIRQKLKKFPIGIYTRYGKGYYLESDNRNGQVS